LRESGERCHADVTRAANGPVYWRTTRPRMSAFADVDE
jgi:hypothetical protein